MGFRGKPSKACERCRARRAKCDLRSGSCGQCVRACVPCSGYRDTQQLRIRDESQSVAKKALKGTASCEPQYLPLPIDMQARAAFFNYYVVSKCWNFLIPYHHPMNSPEHLTLAMEAVSLAYLWFQAYSNAALGIARTRYVSALRSLNNALKSPQEAAKESTLLTPLLLDLFEKITDSGPRHNQSWKIHVDGALALVQLRGIEQFQTPSEIDILLRLSGNYLFSCIASGSTIPDDLMAVQNYINGNLGFHDPGLRLSENMTEYTNLSSQIRRGVLSSEERKKATMKLDLKLHNRDADLPPRWQYSTVLLERKHDRAFDLYFHDYSVPRVCQARNLLRVVRILLNESLIDHNSALSAERKDSVLLDAAHDNIITKVREICASVPQYVDCDGAAQFRLPTSTTSMFTPTLYPGLSHQHTHDHQLDVYTLIYPLYIAGMSNPIPGVRSWIIKQLHYVASHFYIRNAAVVAQILEQGTNVNPWEVYAMLGSYAFQA